MGECFFWYLGSPVLRVFRRLCVCLPTSRCYKMNIDVLDNALQYFVNVVSLLANATNTNILLCTAFVSINFSSLFVT